MASGGWKSSLMRRRAMPSPVWGYGCRHFSQTPLDSEGVKCLPIMRICSILIIICCVLRERFPFSMCLRTCILGKDVLQGPWEGLRHTRSGYIFCMSTYWCGMSGWSGSVWRRWQIAFSFCRIWFCACWRFMRPARQWILCGRGCLRGWQL